MTYLIKVLSLVVGPGVILDFRICIFSKNDLSIIIKTINVLVGVYIKTPSEPFAHRGFFFCGHYV
jgi:hypothetical protein